MAMVKHLTNHASQWTLEEDEDLRKRWLKHTPAELSKQFGRTESAVMERASVLGLYDRGEPREKFTQDMVVKMTLLADQHDQVIIDEFPEKSERAIMLKLAQVRQWIKDAGFAVAKAAEKAAPVTVTRVERFIDKGDVESAVLMDGVKVKLTLLGVPMHPSINDIISTIEKAEDRLNWSAVLVEMSNGEKHLLVEAV